ncbi:MAG: hypothetical protein AAF280_14230 [Pseudomonadota bacterium]
MIRRILLAIPILFVAWIIVLAVVMRVGGEAPGAFVPWPSETFIASLPQDVAITSRSTISVTLQSDQTDLTQRLYEAGARLVLPAGLDACIPAFLLRPVEGGQNPRSET